MRSAKRPTSACRVLAARKAIERAKDSHAARGTREAEAFARLRKASQISGRPLKVVAEALVATLADQASGTDARRR